MPSVQASLEYLQKLALYEEEKPYWCFLQPSEGFNPDLERVDNLEFEEHSGMKINDIRVQGKEFKFDDCGFEVLSHSSKFSRFDEANDVQAYRSETEDLLKDTLGAVYVKCYDSRLRKNVMFQRKEFDLNDLLLTEGPARGVHNGKFHHLIDPARTRNDIQHQILRTTLGLLLSTDTCQKMQRSSS